MTIALLIGGTHGLKEAAVALFADTYVTSDRYISPYSGSMSDNQVKNAIKLTGPTDARYPAFTFLIPGLGSNGGAWSNTLDYNPDYSSNKFYLDGYGSFGFDSDSIVNKIENETGNSAKVYQVMCDSGDTSKYHIYYYHNNSYYYANAQEFKNIVENPYADQHSIIVYNSNNSGQSFQQEYQNFERIANRLCYDFMRKYSFAPRINLIGHSRGGLVAQEYANNYPHNVYSINTLASPFFGSETGALVQRLSTYVLIGGIVRSLASGFLESQGFIDLQDKTESNARRNTWNQVSRGANIRATAYGSCLTLPFISRLLRTTVDSFPTNSTGDRLLKGVLELFVPILINAFEDINNHYKTSSGSPNFKALMTEDKLNSKCTSTDGYAKERLKSALRAIRGIIFGLAGELLNFIRPLLNLIPGATLILWILELIIYIETEFAFDDFAGTLAKNIVTYDGQVCLLKDDFLVSLDSQLCSGYSNYTRLVKVFDYNYLDASNNFGVTEDNVLVGHNLETLNPQITDSIIKRGKFTSKEEILDDVREHAVYQTARVPGSVNYTLNQDDLIIINGHGQLWGEYHATVEVNDVEPNNYDTFEIICYDNHSDAIFFTEVLNFWSGVIDIILYVREDSFDASGYITINYMYESNLVLDGVSITHYPNKTEYFTNQTLDLTGLAVKANYTNGLSKPISNYGVALDSSNAMSVPGYHTVTITYSEPLVSGNITIPNTQTVTFSIYVREPNLVDFQVGTNDCQTEFTTGENFNYNGLQAIAYFEDGRCEHVTNYVVNANNVNTNQLGTYTVYVSYTFNGVTKSDSYEVVVKNAPLRSISLSGTHQRVFQEGDYFNYFGLIVTANYENGYSSAVSDYYVDSSNVDMDEAGTYWVFVFYTEEEITKSNSYSIVVESTSTQRTLTSITLSGSYQTRFSIGEVFNYDGLIVTAHYSDGTSAVVTNYFVNDVTVDPWSVGSYTIRVIYSEGGITEMALYRVSYKASIIFNPKDPIITPWDPKDPIKPGIGKF